MMSSIFRNSWHCRNQIIMLPDPIIVPVKVINKPIYIYIYIYIHIYIYIYIYIYPYPGSVAIV